MKNYTVLATVVAAATIASVAFADLTLSHGQVVKTGQSAKTLCSLTRCSQADSRVERAPAGGVRVAAAKACCSPGEGKSKACGSKCSM